MKPNTRLEEALKDCPPELKPHYRKLLDGTDQEEVAVPEFLTLAEMKAQADLEPEIAVRSTGWSDLDRIAAGGIAEGESILLASQTGAGKTHFAVNLAINYAHKNHRVCYLTLEDGWRMVLDRFKKMDGAGDSLSNVFMIREDELTMQNATETVKNAIEDSELVIVDNLFALPLRQTAKGDYWSSQAEWVDDICNMVRSSHSSCLFLHHLNKQKGGTEAERYQVAGSTRLMNRVAQVWLLIRPEGEERTISIKSEKNRRSPSKGECFLKSQDSGRLVSVYTPEIDPRMRQFTHQYKLDS
jgi:predicted ATP-dependent serine protease